MLKEILLEALSTNMSIDDMMQKPEFSIGMMEILTDRMGNDALKYVQIDPHLCTVLFVSGIMLGADDTKMPRQEIIDIKPYIQLKAKILIFKMLKDSLRTFMKHKMAYTQIMINGIFYGQECALK